MLTDSEVNNLTALLLNEDTSNLEIALYLIEQQQGPTDNRILYALNILSLLLVPQNIPNYQRNQPAWQAKTQLLTRIDEARSRLLALAPQLGNTQNFHQDIYIFAIAAENADKPAYKRWLKKYQTKRRHYEPLFLQNTAWHNAYFQLLRLLYRNNEYWPCIDYADAMLRYLPNNHNVGMYRYNAVFALLNKGEALQEVPKQIQFAQNALLTQHPDSFCMYNVLIANNYYFQYQDNERAETYYRAALEYQKADEKFAKSKHAALAANNLASIIAKRGGNLKEAKNLITLANALSPNSAYYLDSLGFFTWFYEGNTKNALSSLQRALQIDPDHISSHAHLACIYIDANNWPKAKIHINYLTQAAKDKILKEKDHVLRAYVKTADYLSTNKIEPALLYGLQDTISQLNSIH